MRKIAVGLLLVLLAVPAASASPRRDDSDSFGDRFAQVVRHVVHLLDDVWPGPPKP